MVLKKLEFLVSAETKITNSVPNLCGHPVYSGIFEKKFGYKIGGVNGDANHLLQIQLRSNKGLLPCSEN